MTDERMHVALLGDSTLDNRAYTRGGPDVVEHLSKLLPAPHGAALLAVDGAVIDDVYQQIVQVRRMADPATHLVLSVGGNDLLRGVLHMLDEDADTVSNALLRLHQAASEFGGRYRELLLELMEQLPLPTVICTVYGGAFPDPTEAAVTNAALRIFDHEIIEAGRLAAVPVLDLRHVCNEPSDYYNPIEPSNHGGAKIAAAIKAALGGKYLIENRTLEGADIPRR